MKLPTPSAATVKAGAKAVLSWAVGGGLLLWAITASVQWYFARQDAHMAAVQTYNMERVAAFRDSGAELDKKVAAFNDAAAEQGDLSESRQAVRSALADHASKTMAMQDAFGSSETKAYTAELKALQREIEVTNGPTNAGPIITAMSKVIVHRNRLAEAVSKRAIG